MDKVTKDLTGMASFSIGDGVRDHLQPIIAKVWVGELRTYHHELFERLLCLFV